MTDNIFQAKRDRFLLLSGLPGFTPGGKKVPQGGSAGGLSERFDDAEKSRALILKSQRKKKKKSSKKKRKQQRLQALFPRAAGRISEGNLVFTTPQVEANLKANKELVQLKKEKLRILDQTRAQNGLLETQRLRIQTEQIRAGQIRDRAQRGLEHRRLNEEARRFDRDIRDREAQRRADLQKVAEEQATIRERVAREDAQRHAEIQSQRDQALTELGIRGEERQRELDNERFKIDTQRQVDADRAQSDREREETFRQVVDLLRHHKAPEQFGGSPGSVREPSAIDELIDAVEEVGERARARSPAEGIPPVIRARDIIEGGGRSRARSGTFVRESPSTLADEERPEPRRTRRNLEGVQRTDVQQTPQPHERSGGERSLAQPEPEPAPTQRPQATPPPLAPTPSGPEQDQPSSPELEAAEGALERLRARREGRQGGGEQTDET
tara:strand:+ start:1405 stop:2727 length:1323 start_codon:yes stop_codon:yes gene_type:complete